MNDNKIMKATLSAIFGG